MASATKALAQAPLDIDGREELFAAAASVLVDSYNGDVDVPAPPDLSDEMFASPLTIVISSYLASHGDVTGAALGPRS